MQETFWRLLLQSYVLFLFHNLVSCNYVSNTRQQLCMCVFNKMHPSTSLKKLSVRKQEKFFTMGKFIIHPGRSFSSEIEWKRKTYSVINLSVYLLCDLEVGPKVHLKQLCLDDQLHVSCNRWHETALPKQSKGIDLVKMHVPEVWDFCFGFHHNDFELDELSNLVLFVLVFLLCFIIGHLLATVARSH